jgi:pimeloyl-ACP methyl ester carboxylesterase
VERYPDVRDLIRRVLDRVESDPPKYTIRGLDGDSVEVSICRFDLQIITSYLIADPQQIRTLLWAYREADQGRFGFFTRFLTQPARIRGMPELMDIASGISAERLQRVQSQAKTALLGDALNFPMPHLREALPDLDLGEDFRAPLTSDRPALFLSGTLDGRTYPESHAEVAAGFSQGAVVTIENAGHNLFFSHPELPNLIAEFFAGAPAITTRFTAPLPEFVSGVR